MQRTIRRQCDRAVEPLHHIIPVIIRSQSLSWCVTGGDRCLYFISLHKSFYTPALISQITDRCFPLLAFLLEHRQSATNPLQLNLFSPLTHKHTVSTKHRQSIAQAVSIMLTHTVSCLLPPTHTHLKVSCLPPLPFWLLSPCLSPLLLLVLVIVASPFKRDDPDLHSASL